MVTNIIFALGGAVAFALVLRNNPKIAEWFYRSADWVEVKIKERTGKDI